MVTVYSVGMIMEELFFFYLQEESRSKDDPVAQLIQACTTERPTERLDLGAMKSRLAQLYVHFSIPASIFQLEREQ